MFLCYDKMCQFLGPEIVKMGQQSFWPQKLTLWEKDILWYISCLLNKYLMNWKVNWLTRKLFKAIDKNVMQDNSFIVGQSGSYVILKMGYQANLVANINLISQQN
jgi:hypothetical protein